MCIYKGAADFNYGFIAFFRLLAPPLQDNMHQCLEKMTKKDVDMHTIHYFDSDTLHNLFCRCSTAL